MVEYGVVDMKSGKDVLKKVWSQYVYAAPAYNEYMVYILEDFIKGWSSAAGKDNTIQLIIISAGI